MDLTALLSEDPAVRHAAIQATGAEQVSTIVLHLQSSGDLATALSVLEHAADQLKTPKLFHQRASLKHLSGDHQGFVSDSLAALQLDQTDAGVIFGAATAYGLIGKPDESCHWFEKGLQLDPLNHGALTNYAGRLKDVGLIDQAVRLLDRAMSIAPNEWTTVSNRCYVEHFRTSATLQSVRDVHEVWRSRFAVPLSRKRLPIKDGIDLDKPLRIGLPSVDFRTHPVAYYLLPVVEQLKQLGCEIYCYHRSASSDHYTAQFQGLATSWKDARHLPLPELAKTMAGDELDVAIDLSGHTSGCVLPVFAQRVAPLQISWLGYVGTVGVPNIDAVVGSAAVTPEGCERFYHEGLIRLPTHQCYAPRELPEIVIDPPSTRNGYVTFGSLTNIAKINQRLASYWAKILLTVPKSRLRIRGIGGDSKLVQTRMQQLFEPYGVLDRIDLLGFASPTQAMSGLNDIDVLLDPSPFSGCTTTCEALMMGLPPVTLPGYTYASRHTVGFLSAAGMVETVASTAELYVGIAAGLAEDEAQRRHLRANLRQQVLDSDMCDASKTATSLVTCLRKLAQMKRLR